MNINISEGREALLLTQWIVDKEDNVIRMGFHLECNFTHLIFSSSDDVKGGIFRAQVLILFVVLEASVKWTHQS